MLALAVGLGVAGLSGAVLARRWGVVIVAASLLALSSGVYVTLVKVALPHPALRGFWERHVGLSHLFD